MSNKAFVLVTINGTGNFSPKQKEMLESIKAVMGDDSPAYRLAMEALVNPAGISKTLAEALPDADAFAIVEPDRFTLANLLMGSREKPTASYMGDLANLMAVEALKAAPKKSLYKDALGAAVGLEGVALGNRLKPLVKAGVVTVEAKKVTLTDDAAAIAKVYETDAGVDWTMANPVDQAA